MIVEINKDVERYRESVLFGLTAKQSLSALLSLCLGTVIVLGLYPYIGLIASAYVAVPMVAPVALNGFYTYNGMSWAEMWRRRLHFMFANRPLLYVSTEDELQAERVRKDLFNKREQELKQRYGDVLRERKGKKKMVRTAAIIMCVVIMAAVFAWIYYGKGFER